MSDNKIPVIRQDAQINLVVGTNYIKKLQELSMNMIIDRTEDELDSFQKELNENKTEFEEQWKNNYFTVSVLISSIEKAAEEQGFIDMVDAEDVSPQDN